MTDLTTGCRIFQALCGYQAGAVFRQHRLDLLRQKLLKVAVGLELSGQQADRVLPFERAEIGFVHEIAEKALQALRALPRNLCGYCQILRLGLPQPPEAIAVHNARARLTGAIGAAAMLERPEPDQHRSRLHSSLGYLVRLREAVERPLVA